MSIREQAIARGWIRPATTRDDGPTPYTPSHEPTLRLDRIAVRATIEERSAWRERRQRRGEAA